MPFMLSFGKKLGVSVFTLPVVLCLVLSGDRVWYALALGAALLHEAGHLAALRLSGVPLVGVKIYPFGAEILCDTSAVSYGTEALCAAAGPGVSLVLFALSAAVSAASGNVYALFIAAANGAFFAVNILPAKGLDGGVILECLLLQKSPEALSGKVRRLLDAVSDASVFLLCLGTGFVIVRTGYNLSLLFICIYLLVGKALRT